MTQQTISVTAIQHLALPEYWRILDRSVLSLKQGIVLFWAVWLSVIFFANAFDGLKALKIMGQGWRFASGNYALMTETTRKYPLPAWFAGLLFLGVVLWQWSAALLFWYAFSTFHGMHLPGLQTPDIAFLVSLAFWAAFMIAEEGRLT